MMDAVEHFAFGNWLSGFTDGEGCFTLDWVKNRGGNSTPTAAFAINLRADDGDVLQEIKSYFGCGNINVVVKGQVNPLVRYKVSNNYDLVNAVIPHFDKFPLRAKKHRDFEIWREAVLLIYKVAQERVRWYRWTEDENAEFDRLAEVLKLTREYNSSFINGFIQNGK